MAHRVSQEYARSALFDGCGAGLFGLFSFQVGAVGHGLLLGVFFLVSFRRFVAHNNKYVPRLIHPRHVSFSEGRASVEAGRGNVND